MSSVEDRDVSLLAIDQYMRQVRGMSLLADGEEAQLVQCVERGKQERCKPCPDERVLEDAKWARDRLMEGFLRLVIAIARRYVGACRGMELSDLIQEGNIGLLKAIDRHEPAMGYPLITLADRYIHGAILEALYQRDGLVRIDKRTLGGLRQLRLAENRVQMALGREPAVHELAAEMGVDACEVVDLLEVRRRKQVASLQGLVAEDRDEDTYSFVSLFTNAVVADTARQQELEEVLQKALEAVLTQRQREVVQVRYGLDDTDGRVQSQQEAAALLGVSRENIRNVERMAKAKLSQVLRPAVQDGQVSYTVRSTRHDDYYTAREAMQRLGHTSTTTFYRQVYQGRIPGVRHEGKKDVWRFPKERIDQLAERRCYESA